MISEMDLKSSVPIRTHHVSISKMNNSFTCEYVIVKSLLGVFSTKVICTRAFRPKSQIILLII